jgi:hypothetical protein
MRQVPVRHKLIVLLFAATLVGMLPSRAAAIPLNLDFENFADQEILNTQVVGVTFVNAQVLTAGVSLNEIDFPPHSGDRLIYDMGGPMTLSFLDPVLNFSAYFTYVLPLTITATDTTGAIFSVSSAFASNAATFGSAGSAPNELLQIGSALGITSLTITASSFGGSFTLDDLVTTDLPQSVPEPGTLGLMAVGAAAAFVRTRRRT